MYRMQCNNNQKIIINPEIGKFGIYLLWKQPQHPCLVSISVSSLFSGETSVY